MSDSRISPALISRAAAFLVPIVLAMYWPLVVRGATWAPLAIRFTILPLALLIAGIWVNAPSSRAELRWTGLLCVYLIALLAVSVAAPNAARALNNWARILTLVSFGLLIARGLRNEGTSRALGLGLLTASLISLLFIARIYSRYFGYSLPNYQTMRVLKSLVLANSSLALNPLACSAVFMSFAALCLLPLRRTLLLASVATTLGASWMTGSRAPVAVVAGAATITGGVALIRSRRLIACVTGWLLVSGLAGAVACVVRSMDVRELSDITEGRYDLWTVGLQKFHGQVWIGPGAESWKDDMLSLLPGYYKNTAGLRTLKSGSFHSGYVTLLAEEGLVCFIPALLILFILLRDSIRLTSSSMVTTGSHAVLFCSVFLVLRGTIEVPGLFGYGQDVADYLAYILLAVVISRSSVIQDGAPLLRRRLPPVSTWVPVSRAQQVSA